MRPTPLTFGLLIAVHMASSSSSARADGAVMIAGKLSPRERDIIVDRLELTATSMSWKLTRVTYPGTHTIMLRQVNSARSMAMAAADSHSLQPRLISSSTPSRKTEATPASRRA
jgi:hypothetical protein